MPIELNPCGLCGEKSTPLHYPVGRKAYEFSRICPKCGNQSEWKPTRKDANAAWNAANPKEDA